ncbi:25228_t:CDS:2, partial [Gigaspora margarita]
SSWDLAIQEYKNDNRFSHECQQLICAKMKRIGVTFEVWQILESQTWTYINKKSLTNPEKFKVDAQNWINLFLTPSSGKRNTNNFVKGLYNPVDITPYIHVLVYHVAESSETRQSAILNILEYENWALYFLYHNMKEPKFKKIKY